MRISKEKKEIANKWCEKNGACYFDFKNRDIYFYDGGLFSIEKKKIKTHKIVGYKELPNKSVRIIFSKKKICKDEEFKASLWFTDLDGIINYLKRMKNMLNKIGVKTTWK